MDKFTKETMIAWAYDAIGCQPRYAIQNMKKALSMCAWMNDENDKHRYWSATFALNHWDLYQAECEARRNKRVAA